VATRQSERRATWAMRGKLSSPGHAPGWQRDQLERFWHQIARGATTAKAAVATGVPVSVGTRWSREAGGTCPVSLAPASGRYFSLAEREEIAIERARGPGVREIARHLGRSPSTISRKLRRNAPTRAGSSAFRGSTSRAAPGPPVGKGVEPRAGREAPPSRLPGRRDYAHLA